MKRWYRVLCMMLCILMLPVLGNCNAYAEEEAPSVRVLLRRLGLTTRADLTLEGYYTLQQNGKAVMAFPDAAEVTIEIRENELYLFYSDMCMRLGKSAVLQRNQSSREMSGMRFVKNGNLYPGSLSLTIEDGALVPVLTLSVEDYLLGVVPYEMSDSFPLEALKAQAICARTYVLARKNTNRAYDVVDTTNDQVFKGVDPSTVNCARAIQETAGVVGTYKGKLADCFYSASNGGQTELVENVWSDRGVYDYYAMVDDPYDLENPQSTVRTLKLPKDGSISDRLRGILHEKLLPALEKGEYNTELENFRVNSITAVTLASPMFDEPSRRMQDVVLTITWSGKKRQSGMQPDVTPAPAQEEDWNLGEETAVPTATPTSTPTATPTATPNPEAVEEPLLTDFLPEEEAIITLHMDTDTIAALNLTISGSEMFSVTEEETQFLLQSRRFGHGVGMSQRGAQWMAGQYDMTCEEILAFYYPGMSLMKGAAGEQVLPTVPPVMAEQLAPPPTATPKPTLMPVTTDTMEEGMKLMYVNASSLNLRSEPSLGAELLMRLMENQQVIVIETCDDPEWVHVKTDAIEGYCMVSFLKEVEEATEKPLATPTPT